MIICISVNLSLPLTKWTLSSPDMIGEFARTCQSVSSTHPPPQPVRQRCRGVPSCFYSWLLDERGTLFSSYLKIGPSVLCPSWQQWVFTVVTRCQKAMQSSNLRRYLPSKFQMWARRDPPKFRSNPIKLAKLTDSLLGGVWTNTSQVF